MMIPSLFDSTGVTMIEMGGERLLTKAEAAKKIKSTKRTLDRLHSKREGPPRTVLGGRVYFRESSVREWVLSREKPPVRRKAVRQ